MNTSDLQGPTRPLETLGPHDGRARQCGLRRHNHHSARVHRNLSSAYTRHLRSVHPQQPVTRSRRSRCRSLRHRRTRALTLECNNRRSRGRRREALCSQRHWLAALASAVSLGFNAIRGIREESWNYAREKAGANPALTCTGVTIGNPIDWVGLLAPNTRLSSTGL